MKRYSVLVGREIDVPEPEQEATEAPALSDLDRLWAKIAGLPDLAPVDRPGLKERLQGLLEDVEAFEALQEEQRQVIADQRRELAEARANKSVEALLAKIDKLPDPDTLANPVKVPQVKRDSHGRIIGFNDAQDPMSMKIVARDPNGGASLLRVKVGSDQFQMQALRNLDGRIAEFVITPVPR